MTKLLDEALETVRRLPPDDQDVVARVVLSMTRGDPQDPEDVDPAHLPAVLEGLDQIERGDLATDEEVEAVFRSFNP